MELKILNGENLFSFNVWTLSKIKLDLQKDEDFFLKALSLLPEIVAMSLVFNLNYVWVMGVLFWSVKLFFELIVMDLLSQKYALNFN